MQWLDRIPFSTLFIIALVLGLAPFTPEPHLLQKIKMLIDGSLTRPLDIFDLFLHGTPAVLLVLKIIRMQTQKKPD